MVAARDAYRLGRVRPEDLWATISWPGTWSLLRRFRSTALQELRMAFSRRAAIVLVSGSASAASSTAADWVPPQVRKCFAVKSPPIERR